MMIELLCVGSELLSGITLNTNAHWLACQIAGAGGNLSRVTVVRDDLHEISSAVKESLARKTGILITTGGLGSTYDDMTLEGVAKALGKKVALDKQAVEMLKESYERRSLKYELTKARLKMATIPEGSTPIQNPVGSAPGVRLRAGTTELFCLQGVPAEMQAIFRHDIRPFIRKAVGPFLTLEQNYEVEGVSEAMIAPAISRIVDSA